MVAMLVSIAAARDFSPEVENEASEVFHSLMSPYCPGKLIADCPSSKAGELREGIRERIAAGESGDDIREELLATYGEAVRAAPRARGFDLLAWLLPPLVVLLGAVFAVLWLRRRRGESGDGAAVASPPAAIDERTRERLDEELRRVGSG
jgi:cytochrome c-type biogenesis protein CcmH